MSLKLSTPCDEPPYICPYGAEYSSHCEWWCGADEPEDNQKEPDDDTF